MLHIDKVSFRYPGAASATLHEVSLQLEQGRVLGLLGPNGAGKTTLIAHLVGLQGLQQGCISVAGLPLAQVRKETPTRIALAPQEYAFYPMLSVAENLDFFAAACHLKGPCKQQRIAECLALGQLERFRQTRGQHLSGGLKRRLNLAIAMLGKPELLLLDEPTVGVDPQSRAFLLDAVKQLAQQGMTVIYTSHYIEEIEAIADDVAILDEGKVLRHAPLSSLLAEGNTCMQLRLQAHADAAMHLLKSFGKPSLHEDGEIELELSPTASPGSVLHALEAAGNTVTMIRHGQQNLEALFMRLTHRHLRDE